MKDNKNKIEQSVYYVPEDGWSLVPLHSKKVWICDSANPKSPVKVGTMFPGGLTFEEMEKMQGVHLEDCSKEWWASLPADEYEKCLLLKNDCIHHYDPCDCKEVA